MQYADSDGVLWRGRRRPYSSPWIDELGGGAWSCGRRCSAESEELLFGAKANCLTLLDVPFTGSSSTHASVVVVVVVASVVVVGSSVVGAVASDVTLLYTLGHVVLKCQFNPIFFGLWPAKQHPSGNHS